MNSRFENQSAIITGGASGLGLGIAKRLASEGARICLWDSNSAALESAVKQIPGAHPITVDVSDVRAVDGAMEQTSKHLGAVHILIAGAGITGPNAPLWEYPIDAWNRVIQINLFGVFHTNRAVVPHMLRANYGRIVNIASIAGKEGNASASAYSASKAAVIALTKSLGKELAETNIRVNCIAPALIQTPIIQQMASGFTEAMTAKIPMKRLGTVEEVAAMTCWIASGECTFSTGAVFDISGGRATY